jgi:hypothetical protein
MERKIGEIFTYNGKIYQVVKSDICATLSLTLFFHMEKKDGTYDNREVYVHGFPIKL